MNVLVLLHSFGHEDVIACYTAQVIWDFCSDKQEKQSLRTWSLYFQSDKELPNFHPDLALPRVFICHSVHQDHPFI